MKQACKDGYVTLAFGSRLRTPILKQTILDTKITPQAAQQEKRTAANALGQSWCLLNDRACSEFMEIVRNSEYKHDIKPSAKIHDAQYYIVKANPKIVGFVNKHLVKAVQWQDDPEIFHDKVKLSGEVSIFYPDWSKECVIPNGSEPKKIKEIFKKFKKELK